jgi:hypothetical protein
MFKGSIIRLAAVLFVAIGMITQTHAASSVNGTLKLVFNMTSQTNSYLWELISSDGRWELFLEAENDRIHVFGNEDQVVSLRQPIPPEGVILKDGTVTNTINVTPGSYPIDLRRVEHIWFALMSKGMFSDAVVPIEVPHGFVMLEASTVDSVEFPSMSVGPTNVSWYNSRSAHSTSGSRIRGRFYWKETLQNDSSSYPRRSSLDVSLVKAGEKEQMVSETELIIDKISEVKHSPGTHPTFEGRAHVFDYRVSSTPGERKFVDYYIDDGIVPPEGSSVIASAYFKKFGERISDAYRKRLWIVLALLTTTVGGALMLRKQKTKDIHENKSN